MIELALNKNNEGTFQKEIAKSQEISFKYLDQIISTLKSSGLIINVAGRKSGYRITKSADKITIYDIYKAFNSDLKIIDCLGEDYSCKKENQCAAMGFWHGLNERIILYMQSTTLEDLAQEQANINQNNEEITFHI